MKTKQINEKHSIPLLSLGGAWICLLLTVLFAGNVRLHAGVIDPFPSFNYRLYKGNMTITAKVVQNGEVVTDAIVAAYYGDELRGKERVGGGTNQTLVFLTVYGNNTGAQQNLSFKVYTDGNIFTCNPNPAVTFKSNASYGELSNPYIIDITPISLPNNANNTEALETWDAQTCDIVLTDRTLYRDEAWNTLCLPFNLDSFSGTPLEGATVMELDTEARTYAHITGLEDGTLYLNFMETKRIVAGKPYIVKWESGDDIVNPVFTGVTISNAQNDVVSKDGTVAFVGNYSILTFGAGMEDKNILFMGAANTLYYPAGNAAINMGAFRAYFRLSPQANVKVFELNFDDDATAIREVSEFSENSEFSKYSENSEYSDSWYDLGGRKMVNGKWLNGKCPRGIYINNGRKVLVK